MYGTVMVGTLAEGTTIEDLDGVMKEWLDRRVDGFVDERVLLGDDGRSVVMAVRFRDRPAYVALADDPEQDAFYTQKIAPLMAGEVQWFDGEWAREYSS
jgi:hypothetical protein